MNSRTPLLDVRVDAVRYEAEDVLSFELHRPSGQPLPAWTPGAHVDVHLPSGVIRQYSLTSNPDDLTNYRIGVLHVRDGRGGSAEMHRVQAGAHLVISEPRNTFPLVEADEYLLIAGGVGITPILTMARHLNGTGARTRLVYAARSKSRMAFLSEIASLPGVDISLVPQEESGFPDLAKLLDEGRDASVFACGPTGMLDALAALCVDAPPAHGLHVERFSTVRGASVASGADGGDAFEVVLSRTGRSVHVPSGVSVLASVRAAGVDVPSSCEQGICGTCETRVLEGDINHQDMLLSEPERRSGLTMMLCVSRCHGERLVLDL